jgi:hypothetical protein
VLNCNEVGTSNFWKGVMWAVKVAEMSCRWQIENGSKVRFWEDMYIGTSSLAI